MLNKLALGTAQFGFNYGITNFQGQVQTSEVQSILSFAKSHGITTLDTAPGYGKSEQVLGEIGINGFQVITKTEPLTSGVNKVIQAFIKSIDSLEVECVEGLLIRAKDIKDKDIDALYSELYKLKQDKLINKIGFSAYSPEQVDSLLINFDFDLIQVPLNIFDVRLAGGGQLNALKDKDVEIHARSIFLQGILLDIDNLPKYFNSWKEQFYEYHLMVQESGMSLLEYALNFVLNISEIDKVIVGVNSKQQLEEIVQAASGQFTSEAYPINEIKLLNPSLWKI
jgi:aryl-alcohol dehydrogenase-like predicted oxidoreductase